MDILDKMDGDFLDQDDFELDDNLNEEMHNVMYLSGMYKTWFLVYKLE